jgi:pimeloyl-ACP methyl ester carboxylesterase
VWKEFDKQMAPQEDLIKQGKLKEAAEMDVNTWAAAQNPESRKKIMMIALENAHVQLDNPWKHQVSPDPPGYKRLPEITVPTLVMIGDRDVKGMQLIADDLHSKIPGSKKVIVQGADHIVNMSRPEEFNRIVLEFLSATHSRAS